MKVPKAPLHALTLLYRAKHVTGAVLVSRHSGCHLERSTHWALWTLLFLWLAPISVSPLAGSSRPLELWRQQPHLPPEHNPGRLCLLGACVGEDPGSQDMCSMHTFILKGCRSAMMTTFLIMPLPTEGPYWKLNINPNCIAPSRVWGPRLWSMCELSAGTLGPNCRTRSPCHPPFLTPFVFPAARDCREERGERTAQ